MESLSVPAERQGIIASLDEEMAGQERWLAELMNG